MIPMTKYDKKCAVFGGIVLHGMAEIERAEKTLFDECVPEEYSLKFDVPDRGSWIVSIKRDQAA